MKFLRNFYLTQPITHAIMPCTLEELPHKNTFMTRLLSIFLISGLLLLLPIGKVFADVSCQTIYGGGQNCVTTGNILVNKRVLRPSIQKAISPDDCKSQEFVDNLGTNDPFGPNQLVTFQICLTNTGGTTIQQTEVKDTLPSFVTFVSGPGNFDNNTKALTFTTDNLAPNQTRPFIFQAKVIDNSGLPEGVTCVINQVMATTNNGQMSQDNAQFCIQKGVGKGFPVFPPPQITTTPSTGPELIPLISLLPGGALGWILRRKSNKFQGGEK